MLAPLAIFGGTNMTIGVGFIGTGDISTMHAAAVRECPGAELIGVWNRTAEKAQARAAEFGCRAFASPEELVNDPAVNAVFVLTNLGTHVPYSELALNAGKAVLVEKPVGVTVAEVERLRDLADAKGLVCMPGHNYIYEAGFKRTRDMIDAGDLGRVVSTYVLYNIHHPEEVAARYPGVIRSILTHHSYMLLYLAGRPKRLCAMKATLHYEKITQEDLAMVQLEMGDGSLAHLCASFAADDHAGDPWTVLVKVIGTDGSTRYSYRDHVNNKPGPAHSQTYLAYQGSLDNEVRHFLDGCLRRGLAPLSTLDDAILCQRIVEACEASAAESRVIDL